MIWHVDGPWAFGLVGILGTLLWIGVIVLVIVLVVRLVNNQNRQRPTSPPGGSAEDLLRQRFASGEIDEDEYRRRLAVLRGG